MVTYLIAIDNPLLNDIKIIGRCNTLKRAKELRALYKAQIRFKNIVILREIK